ncbi:penicillin-binding transpeptidase domain-containing protein [Dyella marensis]|jgi:cell division protein FtsI (penicillin-binding protein 3)|uniref:Peptidoglycan D,D-transpeptidase FtsI n=1 Tax=Dyella marensis TaxID=500610 RepID=A0A1I2HNW3_9GAMM|nr:MULTISPECIES: penicillin-binding transpeptidase domain-containing protein [Dyella]SFF30051.1 cell division protein FtsI (penicillin-binding protein 3) [Dyella marensis]
MNMRPRFPTQPTARRRQHGPSPRRRMIVVVAVLSLASLGLVARAFDLQVVRKEFYQSQGDARFLREVPIAVSRGTIFDRNGEPLAVSTPVMSIWANPSEVLESEDRLPQLAKAIGMDTGELKQYLMQRSEREFVYLRRQMRPDAAQAVLDLGIPGVNGQREYRRYYPSGEVTSHILGFTNIDDHGQEGLELAFDDWLAGKPGAKRVIRDRMGHIVEDVEQVRAPQPGRNLTLSIDRRIQFLAYNELKNTLEQSQADSGSMVIIDVTTGEVLAMVNLPTYNPNALRSSTPSQRRNRSMTDVVEPGSTIKPVVMAAALSSGKYTPNGPLVDTGNGHFYYMTHDIRDTHAYGMLSPTGVIQKSSNIGAAKIAMTLDTSLLYDTYRAFGLGSSTNSGFPGEASGYLKVGRDWRPLEKAIMAYGYGLNVTALQLANVYATIGDGGLMHEPSFVKGAAGDSKQIIAPEIARKLVTMLESTTQPGGTAAPYAWIANYAVAGKTGTAHKASGGSYLKNNYSAAFAGIVPASNPRMAAVVVIDDPKKGSYYGGLVSAPVFAKVMDGALRLLDVPPDNIGRWYVGGPLQGNNGLVGSKPPDAPVVEDAPVEGATP